MLSLLVGCAGVLEAIACYEHLRYSLLPRERPSIDDLKKTYDSMVAESLTKSPSRSEAWKLGVQGYLDIQGFQSDGKKGALKAEIKYLGSDEDPVPILFSTKISSFGQESFEYESIKPTTPIRTPSRTPDRTGVNIKTQEPQSSSFSLQTSPKVSPSASHEDLTSNFWGEEEEEPKEKIKWHYRPITPTNEDAPLPEIHFDSYERKTQDDDDSTYSEDFLR